MILIGRYLSPFVRRTAVTLKTLGLDYEQRGLSTADDKAEIVKFNPLNRVPSLVLEGGETLIDSNAIIDHLIEAGDPERRLLPAAGTDRRAVLRLTAIAHGAMEKGVASAYERNRRPQEYVYGTWRDMCDEQAAAGLGALDAAAKGGIWLHGTAMTLADITAVCAYDFIALSAPYQLERAQYPALAALSERCNALPAFAETKPGG